MSSFAQDWLLHEAGARDFANVYLAILDELDQHDFRARLESAFAGDWEALAGALRKLGTSYASAGASLREWQENTARLHTIIHPILVDKHREDPRRLVAALATMHAFFDRSFAVLSDAYLSAAQDQVRRSAITLNKRERELKQWEALFKGVAFGICVLGADGTAIEVANDAFMRIYGIESLFDQDDLVRVLAKIIPFAQQSGHGKYETKHVRQDTGEHFPVQVEAVRIPGSDGRPVWGVSVHDLTDRKQVEALRARSRELELENRRVREGSRLKSEFLANMSHELRTPLNSILGFSELLHNGEVGPLSEQQHDFVGDIHSSGKHLLGLINDVLDLSKVEAGKMEFHPEDADLTELVREVVSVLRGVTREKGIVLRVDLQEDVRHVHVDIGRLKQVLYNYLSNAIKFSVRESEITLRIFADDERYFRIEVEDRGQGIAPEDLDRLFREFEQLDSGRGKQHSGTGLGLALTRHLVEAQSGSVGVRSTVGRGSVFYAVLPRQGAVKLPAVPRPMTT